MGNVFSGDADGFAAAYIKLDYTKAKLLVVSSFVFSVFLIQTANAANTGDLVIPVTVFGPERFVIANPHFQSQSGNHSDSNGKLNQFGRNFQASTSLANVKLLVVNGSDLSGVIQKCSLHSGFLTFIQCQISNLKVSLIKRSRVEKILVKINNQIIIDDKNFNKTNSLEIPVSVLAQNTLQISLSGSVGSFVSLKISGETINHAPIPIIRANATEGQAPFNVTLDGSQSFDSDNDTLSFLWDLGDGVTANTNAVSHVYNLPGEYLVKLTVSDSRGATSETQTTIRVTSPDLIPDPKQTAPPIAAGSLFQDQIRFLFDSSNPVQRNTNLGTFEDRRLSLVRGKIISEDLNALAGAKVTVVSLPGLGETLSRTDGEFDFVVNGGGQVVMRFERPGYLPVQRTFRIENLETLHLGDVMMIKPDEKVTTVQADFPSMQSVRGSEVVDETGPRTAQIFIPSQTTAAAILPNGNRRNLSTLSIRITEYSKGVNGLARMPAPLPPETSYTYAADITADEATALGASHIEFSKPVQYYVENFIGVPVGTAVPVGVYDEILGKWIAKPDGQVLKIIAVQNSMAVVSVSEDSSPISLADKTRLGITDGELSQLASSYAVGTELWRAQLSRFSPWDLNFLYYIVDPVIPNNSQVTVTDANTTLPDPNCRISDCSKVPGSSIDMLNLTMSENIDIIDTDFGLFYNSRRAKQFKPDKSIIILLKPVNRNDVSGLHLEIQVAGQIFKSSHDPLQNTKLEFNWNGLDAYGREVGMSNAKIITKTQYDGFYLLPDVINSPNFARITTANQSLLRSRAPVEFEITKSKPIGFGHNYRYLKSAVGEWTINIHHHYDAITKSILFGNGDLLNVNESLRYTRPVAGRLESGFSGDGGPAILAKFNLPSEIVRGHDGSIYVVDSGNYRIRKINDQGIITTVVGNGNPGDSGDGGLAINASFTSASKPAVAADGSIYFADFARHKIRRVNPSGMISTIAGTGNPGFSGEGILATLAELNSPHGLVLGLDGTLYVADSGNHRIRKIHGDGKIFTVVGTGSANFSGDNGPGIFAEINYPTILALGAMEELYFIDTGNNNILRVLNRLGFVSTVTGRGSLDVPNNGTAIDAQEASSIEIRSIDVDPFNTIFLSFPHGVYEISAENKLKLSSRNCCTNIGIVAFADQSVLQVDSGQIAGGGVIRKISRSLPGFNSSGYSIPSVDGSEIFEFDKFGTHLRTLFGKTGALKYEFSYANGGLSAITDQNGLITRIIRDSNGSVSQIISPFGKITQIQVNAEGKLASVTNPNGEIQLLAYNQDLLTRFEQPGGKVSTFEFDDDGYLIKDTNALGGFQSFLRTINDTGYLVQRQTPAGRNSEVVVELLHNYDGAKFSVTREDGTLSHSINAMTFYFFDQADHFLEKSFSVDPRLGSITRNENSLSYYQGTGGYFDPPQIARATGLNKTLSDFNEVDIFRFKENEKFTVYNRIPTQFSGENHFPYNTSIEEWNTLYDSNTRSYVTTSPVGRTSKVLTDSQQRLISVKDGTLTETNFIYNNIGKLSQIESGTGISQRVSSFAYNDQGQLSSTTNPLGQMRFYFYDNLGRISSVMNSLSESTSFQYDQRGNLISLNPPDRSAHTFSFDLLDQISSMTGPQVGGTATTSLFNFDNEFQLNSVTKPTNEILNFQYDAKFRLASVNTPDGNYTLSYDDSTAKVTAMKTPDGVISNQRFLGDMITTDEVIINGVPTRTKFLYDSNFNVRSFFYEISGTGQIRHNLEYDSDGLLTKVKDLNITRDQNGLISTTNLNQVSSSISYNEFAERTEIQASFGTQPNQSVLINQVFTRDQIGRLTSKLETILGVTKNYQYEYDLAGRLKKVFENSNLVAEYNYDKNGNRISGNYRGNQIVSAIDAQDRLVSYNQNQYSYNQKGERILKSVNLESTNYSYDQMGNLKQVILPSSEVVNYISDARGRRILRKISDSDQNLNQRYFYNNQIQIAGIADGSGSLISQFYYGTMSNSPDYIEKAGISYRILHDQLGSIKLVLNTATGEVVQRMDYDEFGKVIEDSNPGFQPFGFAGGLYDQSTKLLHFGARDYDPVVGRWLTKDPIGFGGGDTNIYGYVANDPVNWVDPEGLIGVAKHDGNVLDGSIIGGGGGGSCSIGTGISIGVGVGTSIGSGKVISDTIIEQQEILIDPIVYSKGERGKTAKASGTDNPYKHTKQDPANPGKIIVRDPHTGKSYSKDKPDGWDKWNQSKKGRAK